MILQSLMMSWVGRYVPVSPTLRKQRQEGCKIEISLGYIARPSLKKSF
jgi:hypothetical protein